MDAGLYGLAPIIDISAAIINNLLTAADISSIRAAASANLGAIKCPSIDE